MSETLKPWYAIATPHEDIREGRLAEAVFAANVWAVVQDTAPEVYLDPEEFFRKTYLTAGLSTVLSRVAGALRCGGESGDRIISLQTAFGGGKTHTLVALWHLAKLSDRLKGSPHAEGLRRAIGKDLKLACSRQGLNWNYADGALLELENRCFYLHTATAGSLGKRYWFGTKPALIMLVVKYREQSAKENFGEEILEDLSGRVAEGRACRCDMACDRQPHGGPPGAEAAHPAAPAAVAGLGRERRSEGRDPGTREGHQHPVRRKGPLYRNTLLFLVGTTRGLSKLRQAHRERAALEGVRADYWDQLDDEQREDLKKRLDAARKAALEALGPAYTVALRVRGQEVEPCALSDARRTFQEHLGYVWTTLVEDEKWILRRVGSVTLESTGLIPKGDGLRLKDAVEAFL